jgi:hypothetical protein
VPSSPEYHQQSQLPQLDISNSLFESQNMDGDRGGGGENIGHKGNCPRLYPDASKQPDTHTPYLNVTGNNPGRSTPDNADFSHYHGTMVCEPCPSITGADVSFNRSDVFKSHLTSVHGVKPARSRDHKKKPGILVQSGKCSTCVATFNNAVDFYEHLDGCLRRVEQGHANTRKESYYRYVETSYCQLILAKRL